MSTEPAPIRTDARDAMARLPRPVPPEDEAAVRALIDAEAPLVALDAKAEITTAVVAASQERDLAEQRAATHRPRREAVERQLAEAPRAYIVSAVLVLIIWGLDQVAQFVVVNAGLPYAFDIAARSPLGIALTLTAVLLPMLGVKITAARIFGLERAWDAESPPALARARAAWLWCSIPFVVVLAAGLYMPPALAGMRALAIEADMAEDADAEEMLQAQKGEIARTATFMALSLTVIGAVAWTYGVVHLRRANRLWTLRREVASRRTEQHALDQAAADAVARLDVARYLARDIDVIAAARRTLFVAKRLAELQAACSQPAPATATVRAILHRRSWPPAA